MKKWKDILLLLLIVTFLFSNQASARFISPDPVGLVDPATGKVNQQMLLNPQLQNRYVYALNNPYRYLDPDGNFPILAAPIIAAGIAFFSGPDVANTPTSSSAPIYESHGVRNIIVGAVGGAGVRGVGSVLAISNGIPSKVTDTLAHIKKTGNAPSGYKGGRNFKNDGRGGGQQLPQNSASGKSISYKEYDVNPYKKGVNRGAERIVRGSNGKSYYTNDHYKTFKSIK